MGRTRRIQDAIHGLIELRGREASLLQILRAKEVQRLRRIRQLGLAHYVFPCAEHSRLVHSIGAAHIAMRFTKELRRKVRDHLPRFLVPDDLAVRDMGLAGLCHDLGHGPLSHPWEEHVIRPKYDHKKWCTKLGLADIDSLAKLSWHELVGQALLRWEDGELHKLLEELGRQTSIRVAEMLRGKYFIPYLPRLLAGEIDVDRCDFILRDGRQTGVSYGTYDLEWLVSTIAVGTRRSGELVAGFDSRRSPPVVEQMLRARRDLYTRVYYHPTVHSAETMVGLLLRRLGERPEILESIASKSSVLRPYSVIARGDALSPEELLLLDDNSIWMLVHTIAGQTRIDSTANELARRIVSRDLYKAVPELEDGQINDFLARNDAWQRINDSVRPYTSVSGGYGAVAATVKFKMLSGSPLHETYVIEQRPGGPAAIPFRDAWNLREHFREEWTETRLFAPRESLAALRQLVASHA